MRFTSPLLCATKIARTRSHLCTFPSLARAKIKDRSIVLVLGVCDHGATRKSDDGSSDWETNMLWGGRADGLTLLMMSYHTNSIIVSTFQN